MIDLKKELGGSALGGQWLVGRTENLPVKPGKGVFEYNGMTLITRNSQQTILAIDYPDFYALSTDYYNDYFYSPRYTTGVTTPLYCDGHDNTVIAVGATGGISRSTDGATTWAVVSSGVSANLRVIHYNVTNTKWYIPYATNKCLISSNDGASWVDTTCTGLTWSGTNGTYMRMESIGNITVFSCGEDTFVTTNGVAWTKVTLPSNTHSSTGGKLANYNGWFTLLLPNSTGYASQNGTSWTKLNNGNAWLSAQGNTSSAWDRSYGIVFDGFRWIVATAEYRGFYNLIDSGVSKLLPAPTNAVTVPSYSVNFYSYSATSNPTSAWNYITGNYGGGTSSNWGYNGGDVNWTIETSSGGFGIGRFTSVGDLFDTESGYWGTSPVPLHAVGAFNTWHAANLARGAGGGVGNDPATTTLSALSPAYMPDISCFGMNTTSGGVTQSGRLWGINRPGYNSSQDFLTLSGVSGLPSRILPAYTNIYGGEGVACTRIK